MNNRPYGDDLLHHIAGDQDEYLVSVPLQKPTQEKEWLNSLVYKKFSNLSTSNIGLVLIEDQKDSQSSVLTILWEDGTLSHDYETAVKKCENGNTEEDRNLRPQILAKVVTGMAKYTKEEGC